MSSQCNKIKFIVNTSCVLILIFNVIFPGVIATKPEIIRAVPSWSFIDDGVYLIQEGDELRIECQGEGKLQFSTQKITGDIQQTEYEIINDPYSDTYTFIRYHTLPEDTGWYACAEEGIEIKNDEQTIEHPSENISWIYVYVNSLKPFAVMGKKSFFTIQVVGGRHAVIPCRPTSPELPVILTENGEPIDQEERDVTYDPKIGFIIPYVDGSDPRTDFECTINGISVDPFLIYTLNILTTDRLSDSDVTTDTWLSVALGQNLTLHCEITVNKDAFAKLNWNTPNSIASEEKRLSNALNKVDVSSRKETRKLDLTITNAVEHDAGEYICVVEGAVDTVQSSTNVTILDPTKPFISYTVKGNKNSIIESENHDAIWLIDINTYPPANLTWYKNGKLIENLGSDSSSKYSIIADATTYAYQISKLDINDNGNYTIRISTSNETKVIPLRLTVEVIPFNVIRNPSRLYKPGEIAVLSCITTGSPRPLNVNWTFSEWSPEGNVKNTSHLKYAKPLQKKSAFSAVSELNMPISSMGNLTCSACNEGGCNDTTVPIFVSEMDGFFDIIRPGFQEVVEGDNLTLICATSLFNYTNNIEWILKNPVEPGSNEMRMNAVNDSTKFTWQSKLEIWDVKLSDAGIYPCQAENQAGHKDMINHTLVVVESSEVFFDGMHLNNTDMRIDPNSEKDASRNLTCVAKGMPPPKVTWYKNGEPLTYGGQHVLSSDESTLFITFFIPGKGGNYSCVAKNRLNSMAESYVDIIVEELSNSTTIWISLICVLIVIIIVVITYMGIKVHRERILRKELLDAGLTHFEEGALECLNPDLTIDDQAELLPYDKKWEFPRELLKLGRQLGSGAFGVVMKAEARGIIVEGEVTTVAVKMVRRSADPSYMKALSSELKIMIHLGRHLNVVNLLGACTKTILTKRELYVIVEYCRFGNLHNYLQRNRAIFIDQIDPSTQKINPSIGIEFLLASESVSSPTRSRYGPSPFSRSNSGISNNSNSDSELIYYRHGMEFGDVSMSPEGGVLSNNSIQPGWRSNYRGDYRDQTLKPICTQDVLCWAWQVSCGMKYLSGRNVLHGDLAARNILLADDNVVKICDFGLAKNMYKDNNYKKKSDSPLPIKWMAVESIRDRIFSTQSDVWSFGIVLWEFFTLSQTPYPGMEAEKQYDRLIEGYRMEKPQYATKEIYDCMLNCWDANPSSRPTFPELVERLGALLNEGIVMHYLEMNSPYLEMNTLSLQKGHNDYLTMMSAPSHNYHNTSDLVIGGPGSDYLPMSPINKINASGIFSPRTEVGESHFGFPSPVKKDISILGTGNPVEILVDVHQESFDPSNPGDYQRPTINEEPKNSAVTKGSDYINLGNQSFNIEDQNLNEIKSQKNINEQLLSLPKNSEDNNYINIPKNIPGPPKDTTQSSLDNPSYVIMSSLKGDV